MKIYGVDFTCAPRKAKPITIASGVLQKKILRLRKIVRAETFAAFEEFLSSKGPWVGGFDLPFALPAAVDSQTPRGG